MPLHRARYRLDCRLSGLLLCVFILLTGCTYTQSLRKDDLTEHSGEAVRVLLMPMEIELGELTAGGLVEPRADWTQAAQQNLEAALEALLASRNAALVMYEPPVGDPKKMHRHNQLIKLHRAVAATIIRYKYGRDLNLPTKKGKLDWTLGQGAQALRQEYQADYALFIFIQDTYTSLGRGLLSLAISALVLFPVLPGGALQGVASLVDLQDGEVEWFNQVVSYSGNLRKSESARAVIKNLLADLPLASRA